MNNIVQTFKNQNEIQHFILYRLAGDGMRRGKEEKKYLERSSRYVMLKE